MIISITVLISFSRGSLLTYYDYFIDIIVIIIVDVIYYIFILLQQLTLIKY